MQTPPMPMPRPGELNQRVGMEGQTLPTRLWNQPEPRRGGS